MPHLVLTFATVTAFLKAHVILAYAVLFLGSFFETLIGFGFFVYGEVFFIPGAILAGAGILDVYLVMFVLVVGGVLGDTSSYFIGRYFGKQLFKGEGYIFNPKNHKRGEDLFTKYGSKGIFFARFLGPLSWVTPFFAGMYRVNYLTFLFYNIPGVTLAIGWFVVLGYFFGTSYQAILDFFKAYALPLSFVLGICVILYLLFKAKVHEIILHERTSILRAATRYTPAIVVLSLILLVGAFYFVFSNEQIHLAEFRDVASMLHRGGILR